MSVLNWRKKLTLNMRLRKYTLLMLVVILKEILKKIVLKKLVTWTILQPRRRSKPLGSKIGFSPGKGLIPFCKTRKKFKFKIFKKMVKQ